MGLDGHRVIERRFASEVNTVRIAISIEFELRRYTLRSKGKQ